MTWLSHIFSSWVAPALAGAVAAFKPKPLRADQTGQLPDAAQTQAGRAVPLDCAQAEARATPMSNRKSVWHWARLPAPHSSLAATKRPARNAPRLSASPGRPIANRPQVSNLPHISTRRRLQRFAALVVHSSLAATKPTFFSPPSRLTIGRRLPTCPTLGFALIAALALPLAAATVSGTVELRDSREPAVRKGQDFSGVVVSLEPANGILKTATQTRHAQMVQKNKTFTPHVLAVMVGTTVDFPNYDPIFHNAFSTYNGQLFDVGLYPPGSTRGVRFARAGVVRVFCNIHANMSAIIVALDTPFFDKTRADGHFEIANVPPGDYILHVFHERATAATLEHVSRKIAVEDDPVTLPGMTISESGYLPIPHKNKYGRDYAPAPDEGGVYPAVRK